MKAFLLAWVSFITHPPPLTVYSVIFLLCFSGLLCESQPAQGKWDNWSRRVGVFAWGTKGKKRNQAREKEVSTLGTQEAGPGPVGSPLPGPPAKCPTGNFTSEMRVPLWEENPPPKLGPVCKYKCLRVHPNCSFWLKTLHFKKGLPNPSCTSLKTIISLPLTSCKLPLGKTLYLGILQMVGGC